MFHKLSRLAAPWFKVIPKVNISSKVEQEVILVDKAAKKSSKHWYDFFATKYGQKASLGIIFMIGGQIVVFKAAPHTVFMDTWKGICQHHTQGKPTPVSDKLTGLIKEVMDDLNLTDEEVGQTRAYITAKLDDPFAWGCYNNIR
jgi:hypothetical protein